MKKYAKETWVGVFMTVGLIGVVYLAIRLGDVPLFGGATYPLSARFNAVASLRQGNPVTIMGIDIGRVDAIEIDQERRQAVVHFRIDKQIKVYSDAMASIKTRGLIGEKYLEIDAGGGGELLTAGQAIVDTVPAVDLGDIIAKFAFGNIEVKQ